VRTSGSQIDFARPRSFVDSVLLEASVLIRVRCTLGFMPTRRRNGELVRGVFKILLEAPEGLAVSEILKSLEQRVPPTAAEQQDYPNRPGVRRYGRIVRFATIGPVKAGWLVKDKGIWTLTDDGRSAYEAFPDPVALAKEWTRLYRVWKKSQPEPGEEEMDDDELGGGDETATRALEEAEESAWTEIRGHLSRMPPYDFQDLVAALLKAMGYHVLWVAPPGPDRGVDMIAHNDPLGATSPRIKVQVKRRSESKISREGVSAFAGTLGAADVGIYVSAGGFTAEAERESRSQDGRRITLIDLNRLVELWIEHFDRLDDTARQLLPLKPIYFLVPED
jgi:restriction system protein